MKYVVKDLGKTADVSSGEGSQLLELAKLLCSAVFLILSIYFATAYLTEYVVSNISVENEKKWLGKLNVFELETIESTDDIKRVEDILHGLIQHSDVPDLDYKIVVLDKDSINAFAFPGGTIGITRGLLEEIQNEQALAFVISHELGHFKYRHHLEGFSRAVSSGIIFSIIFGNQSDLIITQNIITLLDRSHSQQQETESDTYAAKLVFDTYGTTEDIDLLFRILEDKKDDLLSIEFLSTHPGFDSRINNLRLVAQKLNNLNSG